MTNNKQFYERLINNFTGNKDLIAPLNLTYDETNQTWNTSALKDSAITQGILNDEAWIYDAVYNNDGTRNHENIFYAPVLINQKTNNEKYLKTVITPYLSQILEGYCYLNGASFHTFIKRPDALNQLKALCTTLLNTYVVKDQAWTINDIILKEDDLNDSTTVMKSVLRNLSLVGCKINLPKTNAGDWKESALIQRMTPLDENFHDLLTLFNYVDDFNDVLLKNIPDTSSLDALNNDQVESMITKKVITGLQKLQIPNTNAFNKFYQVDIPDTYRNFAVPTFSTCLLYALNNKRLVLINEKVYAVQKYLLMRKKDTGPDSDVYYKIAQVDLNKLPKNPTWKDINHALIPKTMHIQGYQNVEIKSAKSESKLKEGASIFNETALINESDFNAMFSRLNASSANYNDHRLNGFMEFIQNQIQTLACFSLDVLENKASMINFSIMLNRLLSTYYKQMVNVANGLSGQDALYLGFKQLLNTGTGNLTYKVVANNQIKNRILKHQEILVLKNDLYLHQKMNMVPKIINVQKNWKIQFDHYLKKHKVDLNSCIFSDNLQINFNKQTNNIPVQLNNGTVSYAANELWNMLQAFNNYKEPHFNKTDKIYHESFNALKAAMDFYQLKATNEKDKNTLLHIGSKTHITLRNPSEINGGFNTDDNWSIKDKIKDACVHSITNYQMYNTDNGVSLVFDNDEYKFIINSFISGGLLKVCFSIYHHDNLTFNVDLSPALNKYLELNIFSSQMVQQDLQDSESNFKLFNTVLNNEMQNLIVELCAELIKNSNDDVKAMFFSDQKIKEYLFKHHSELFCLNKNLWKHLKDNSWKEIQGDNKVGYDRFQYNHNKLSNTVLSQEIDKFYCSKDKHNDSDITAPIINRSIFLFDQLEQLNIEDDVKLFAILPVLITSVINKIFQNHFNNLNPLNFVKKLVYLTANDNTQNELGLDDSTSDKYFKALNHIAQNVLVYNKLPIYNKTPLSQLLTYCKGYQSNGVFNPSFDLLYDLIIAFYKYKYLDDNLNKMFNLISVAKQNNPTYDENELLNMEINQYDEVVKNTIKLKGIIELSDSAREDKQTAIFNLFSSTKTKKVLDFNSSKYTLYRYLDGSFKIDQLMDEILKDKNHIQQTLEPLDLYRSQWHILNRNDDKLLAYINQSLQDNNNEYAYSTKTKEDKQVFDDYVKNKWHFNPIYNLLFGLKNDDYKNANATLSLVLDNSVYFNELLFNILQNVVWYWKNPDKSAKFKTLLSRLDSNQVLKAKTLVVCDNNFQQFSDQISKLSLKPKPVSVKIEIKPKEVVAPKKEAIQQDAKQDTKEPEIEPTTRSII